MPELGCIYLQPDRHDRLKAFIAQVMEDYYLERGELPRGYILNLPRAVTVQEIKHSCKTIEELKDGIMQSNFAGKTKNELIKVPHVVVLSNNGPDLTAQSGDRWQVYWIGNGQVKYCLQPVVVHPFVVSYDPDLRTVRWNTKLVPIGYKEYNNCDSGEYNEELYDPEITEFRETVVDTKLNSTGPINNVELYTKYISEISLINKIF